MQTYKTGQKTRFPFLFLVSGTRHANVEGKKYSSKKKSLGKLAIYKKKILKK